MLWLILSCVLLDYAEGFIYNKSKNRRSRKQKQTRKHASIMKTAISFFNSRVGNTDKNIVNKASCRAILSENASLTTYFVRIKAKPLDEIKKNTYLCVILHVKHKQFLRLNLIIILGKIQDGGEDGEHVWRHYRPLVALHPSCRHDERLSTEGNFVFEILQDIKNSRKGLHQLPLGVQRRGYDCVYVRGKL